ncbi:unnamed protein product, partial [marine sediment metagenome]
VTIPVIMPRRLTNHLGTVDIKGTQAPLMPTAIITP